MVETLASKCRSEGIPLILATRRPAGKWVSTSLKANLSAETVLIRIPCDVDNIGCTPRRKRGVRPNQWRYQMAELPPPPEGIVLAHFIVSDDVERSRRFYTEVLGGRVVFSGPEG